MSQTVYSDLFEDEVSAILRSFPIDKIVIMDSHHEYYPACTICEDGIYTSGKGLFTEYLDGKRTGNHVGLQYFINALAHKTFSIIER